MDRSIRTLLDTIAESPQPVTTVDVDRAMQAGRRKVRLRRLGGAASVAIAIVAVIGVTSAVLSGGVAQGPGLNQTSSQPPPTTSAAPPRLPAAAPESFDPLVRYAEFGWLPDGLVERHSTTGQN
jgi:hypothetical protein